MVAASKASKAQLVFPVGRIHRFIKQGRYAKRANADAAVYLAGVLEFLTAAVLKHAGDAAEANQKKKIEPRHIQLAIRRDSELVRLLRYTIIPGGGVLPSSEPIKELSSTKY